MKLMEKYSNGNVPPFAPDGTRHPLIWVIVADSENAFIYQKQHDNIELIALAKPDDKGVVTEADKNSGHSADGGVHYASNPRDRENHHPGKIFAKEVADWLTGAEQRDAFDGLILIAGPRTLGDLRAALPRHVQDMVQAEVAKDLTSLTAESLLAYFSRPLQ